MEVHTKAMMTRNLSWKAGFFDTLKRVEGSRVGEWGKETVSLIYLVYDRSMPTDKQKTWESATIQDAQFLLGRYADLVSSSLLLTLLPILFLRPDRLSKTSCLRSTKTASGSGEEC